MSQMSGIRGRRKNGGRKMGFCSEERREGRGFFSRRATRRSRWGGKYHDFRTERLRSRPAEAEELGAVRGRKGHGFVGAVIGDAGGIRDPACGGGQRAGLFQREI